MAITPKQAAAGLRMASKEMKVVARRAFNVELRPIRKTVRRGLKRSRLGRAFWGRGAAKKRKRKIPFLMKTLPAKVLANGSMTGGFRLIGMALMVEQGGETRSHKIPGNERGLLRIGRGRGRKSGRVVRGPVSHPGSRFSGVNVAEKELREGEGRVSSAINRGFAALAKRAEKGG